VTAASYGICVSTLGGSTAFFQFASTVFEGQDGLATPDGATLTLNSAVTKAGLDPAKIAACAATPQTKAAVDASVKLAEDLAITQVPTLVINGRQVPANAPYDTLKKIIEFQIKMDGLTK
jgi:protein-disulfide isomerase